MRKSVSTGLAGMLAASALVIASPAQAQPEVCDSPDPVVAYLCQTVESVPGWVRYYYDEVRETAEEIYCKVKPPCR